MAQAQVAETKTNGEYNANTETLTFQVTLSNLNGIEPLTIEVAKDASFADMNQSVNQLLKLGDDSAVELIKPTYLETIPPAFPIKVGAADHIDFEKGIFEISSDTRFIQYGNDFLDEAKMYDDESKTDQQTEGEIRFDGNLTVKLQDERTLIIGNARIQFQRTV